MKKLRVAVLIDAWLPFYGGGQVHVRETTKIIKKKYNCDIVLFHGFGGNIILRSLWNFLVIPQVLISHFRKPFDLIHAHAYSAGLSGKILSLILKIPIVFTVHGANSLDLGKKGPKVWLEKIILTKIKYDCQISVSRSFLKHKNVNKNIKVIPNGANIKKLKIKYKKSKTHIKNEKIRLLFIGRLEEIKGVDILLKALARVKNKPPGWELRIVGEGSRRKNLENLVQRADLCGQIKFLGRKIGQSLIREYQKADLFVLPSRSEAQPLTLLEAWAAGLPVLATSVGDNPQMVKEGKNGFLVKSGSVSSLSRGLLKAFKKQKQWKKIGQRGYNLVAKNYTWEKTAEKIYKVYKNYVH